MGVIIKIIKKTVDTVVGRVCDVCEQSLYVDVDGQTIEECGELRAKLGFGSKQDGQCYQIDLFESCFMVAFYALRDKRKTEFMFSDKNDFFDENFGLKLDC